MDALIALAQRVVRRRDELQRGIAQGYEQALRALQQGGCVGVDIGMESGDPATLLRIGKGVTCCSSSRRARWAFHHPPAHLELIGHALAKKARLTFERVSSRAPALPAAGAR